MFSSIIKILIRLVPSRTTNANMDTLWTHLCHRIRNFLRRSITRDLDVFETTNKSAGLVIGLMPVKRKDKTRREMEYFPTTSTSFCAKLKTTHCTCENLMAVLLHAWFKAKYNAVPLLFPQTTKMTPIKSISSWIVVNGDDWYSSKLPKFNPPFPKWKKQDQTSKSCLYLFEGYIGFGLQVWKET